MFTSSAAEGPKEMVMTHVENLESGDVILLDNEVTLHQPDEALEQSFSSADLSKEVPKTTTKESSVEGEL